MVLSVDRSSQRVKMLIILITSQKKFRGQLPCPLNVHPCQEILKLLGMSTYVPFGPTPTNLVTYPKNITKS